MTGIGFDAPGVWRARGRGFSMALAAPEGRVLRFTGQVAWDEDERIVGLGDPAAQARRCFENVERLLRVVGGDLGDVVEITTWLTDAAHLPAVQKVRAEMLTSAPQPVSTSVVVAALGHPDFLVELTPVAVIPHERFRDPRG
ncbi:MAG: RidA family protein [Pseudomonadota bacterium]